MAIRSATRSSLITSTSDSSHLRPCADQLVELVDIGTVVLAVMVLQRLPRDVRLERIEGVRQFRQRMKCPVPVHYWTRMSFFTAFTPGVLRAICSALSASRALLAVPLRRTVPWLVSTLIFEAETSLSRIIAVLTLVVMAESSTAAPVFWPAPAQPASPATSAATIKGVLIDTDFMIHPFR